ncbi:MAG: metallophosphoesterase [Polyangia bacterium]
MSSPTTSTMTSTSTSTAPGATRRHIVIGDIHGCYGELLELLDRAGATSEDVIVSVGDLVDRGPDSPAVLRFFQERVAQGRAVVLMGNHERKHVRQVFSYSQEITRLQFGEGYPAAVEWMSRLPYSYETPECIVVHAGLVPGVPLAEQKEEVLCGTVSGERELTAALGDRYWHEVYAGPKPVAFGHHVVGPEPLCARGLIYGLDTGACHGGRLTALCLPEFTLVSVPARADHWELEKRKWQEPVLLGKPWLDMGFAKAARELERYADEGGATLAALRAWLEALGGTDGADAANGCSVIQTCHKELLAAAARLAAASGSGGFAAAAEPLPYKALLHLAQRGRLDLDAVRKRCATPARTLELAAMLGVAVPPSPLPR